MSRDPSAKVNITLRLPEWLRAKVEGAARGNDQSINNEINRRIEKSFFGQELTYELFSGPETVDLLKAIGSMVSHLERILGETWKKDRDLGLQASAGIIGFLQALNGLHADEILRLASDSSAMGLKANAWREAAIAAAAQVLGTTLGEAAKKVDQGPPPKEGVERFLE